MTDDFQVRKTAVAGAVHSCEQCGSDIAIGETHSALNGAYFGDEYDYCLHLECENAARAYADLHNLRGDEWPWFQFQDDEPEDWKWMVEDHPIVAKRLGWDERLKELMTDDSEDADTPAVTPGEQADG